MNNYWFYSDFPDCPTSSWLAGHNADQELLEHATHPPIALEAAAAAGHVQFLRDVLERLPFVGGQVVADCFYAASENSQYEVLRLLRKKFGLNEIGNPHRFGSISVPVMKYLCRHHLFSNFEELIHGAVEKENLPLIEWIVKKRSSWLYTVGFKAFRFGSPVVAEFALDHGFKPGHLSLECAVVSHQFAALMPVLRGRQLDWPSSAMKTMFAFQENYSLDRLIFLAEHGCPWDLDQFYANPPEFGAETTEWIKQHHGLDPTAIAAAAERAICNHRPSVFQWCLEQGYAFVGNEAELAITANSLGCLSLIASGNAWGRAMELCQQRYLVHSMQNHCNAYSKMPMIVDLVETLLDQLKELRRVGCPWQLETFRASPTRFPIDLIRWLIGEQQVGEALLIELASQPCNARTLALEQLLRVNAKAALAIGKSDRSLLTCDLAAAAAELFERQLHALRKIGCPWNGRVWWNAARTRNQSVLELAARQQCPWDSGHDWSQLCRLLDWRWLHDHGSPCTKKHSARKRRV